VSRTRKAGDPFGWYPVQPEGRRDSESEAIATVKADLPLDVV
jgi:hypothetical protein